MSCLPRKLPRRPMVWLVGQFEHPDFDDAVAILRSEANLASTADSRTCPELIVFAQSRPSIIRTAIAELRQRAPLAGVVSLLGSWCEGQARGNRPPADVLRVYWHEFPSWWRRQLALRAAGRCPDWARFDGHDRLLNAKIAPRSAAQPACRPSRGVVVLNTPRWDTADVLADIVHRAGYATVWQLPGRPAIAVRGAAAGIWEGSQLDDREAVELAAFCARWPAGSAPVLALLDFPRRDRCAIARQAGAAAVLGKPWRNADLLAAVELLTNVPRSSSAA